MIVSLLTDYGHDDEFVGICHAVIRSIVPQVPIVDLTHGIPSYDIRHGAVVLANSLPYLPVGVHVAIVDPQVGTERRAVAVRTADGRMLIGPDNGVLSLAWQRAGGVVEAVDVSRSRHRLEPVSATFHGRDVFAPVAAQLAAGEPLSDAGQHVEPDELQAIELPAAEVREGEVVAHALLADRFGNVSLGVRHEQLAGSGLTLGARIEVEVGGERFDATFAQTFADVGPGEILLYEDAHRTLALAINRGDARAAMQLEPDARVVLRPR